MSKRIVPVPPKDRQREGDILIELPNTLGLVLWQARRNVFAWSDSSSELRACLFKPPTLEVHAKLREARASAPELVVALDTFEALKADPNGMDLRRLASACSEIVTWADLHEHTRTAIEWAELAARVDPENPRFANIAGRLARNACEYDRAEVWFRRGIGLAREQANVAEQVWGHLGYGRVFQELGFVKGAREQLGRGSTLAYKKGPSSLAASAQHDLAAMLMVRGHLDEAELRARRALAWYPKNHERLPYFAADVGLLFVLAGRFSAAARVSRRALRLIKAPSVQTMVLALISRAYAGMGEPEESAVFRRRCLKMLEKNHRALEVVARWHLADAQRLAGRWDIATREAQATLDLAAELGDRETVRLTQELIRHISERRRSSPAPPALDTRQFVQELTTRLSEWSPRRGRSYPGPWGENRAA